LVFHHEAHEDRSAAEPQPNEKMG